MRKLTTEEFIQKSNNIHSFKYDYSKSIYTSIKDNIIVTCPIHGDFVQRAEKHITGRGCHKCGTAKQKETCLKNNGVEYPTQNKKIQEKIKKSIIEKYGGYGSQSNYIKDRIKKTNILKYGVKNVFQLDGVKDKIRKTKLKRYGSETFVNTDKAKQTCLKKYGVDNIFKLNKNRNNVINKIKNNIVNEIFSGNRLIDIIPLFSKEDYINVKCKYKWQCTKCNTIFFDNLDDGKMPRCPSCFPYKFSKIELEIINHIKSILPNDEILLNDRKTLNGMELDIYLPNKKIAIEINGLYFHTEITGKKDRHYHLNKTNLCREHGIQLIHIFEDEIVHKIDIVKSRINNLLGITLNKIYARECDIRLIDKKECRKFLDNNHIQGKDNSSIKIGAYYNGELVSVMTFGKLRKSLGSKSTTHSYEMYRFCSKLNTIVVGIASKLFNFFTSNYNPDDVISYCDVRYGKGKVYEIIGFKQISTTPPNYWYTTSNLKRNHRYNFRKDVLNKKLNTFDDSMSEWENMKNNGWDRIWDCGNIKYKWVK